MTGFLLIAGFLGLLWIDGRVSDYLEVHAIDLPWCAGGSRGIVLAAAAVLALAPLLGLELAAMLRGAGIAAPTWLTVISAMVGVYLMRVLPGCHSPQQATALLATGVWGVLFLALIVHARFKRVDGVVPATGGTLLAFVYIGLMLGVWLLVRDMVGVWVLAGAMLTVKTSDSGAYFTGRAIGKHKLIPWLSPGKTWEGIVGGVVAAAVVGGALAYWSTALGDHSDHVPVMIGVVGGALLGVVGPLGDLAESLLKRAASMKDSGKVLPGMGGVFDVLDSPLLAGPVVYWLLQFRTS